MAQKMTEMPWCTVYLPHWLSEHNGIGASIWSDLACLKKCALQLPDAWTKQKVYIACCVRMSLLNAWLRYSNHLVIFIKILTSHPLDLVVCLQAVKYCQSLYEPDGISVAFNAICLAIWVVRLRAQLPVWQVKEWPNLLVLDFPRQNSNASKCSRTTFKSMHIMSYEVTLI